MNQVLSASVQSSCLSQGSSKGTGKCEHCVDTITAARLIKTEMRSIGCDAEVMETKAEGAKQKTRIDEDARRSTQRKER